MTLHLTTPPLESPQPRSGRHRQPSATHRAALRRSGFGALKLSVPVLSFLMLGALVLSAGCGDVIADRADDAAALARVRFGEDNRQAVDIRPGIVLSAASEASGRTTLAARATGPFPRVIFDNGTLTPNRVTLTLENTSPSATFIPTLVPLTEEGRKDPGCDAAEFDGRSEVVLPAVEPEREGTTLTFTLAVPRCSRMRLRAQPSANADSIRLAILGSTDGDGAFIGDVLDAMRDDLPDHIHVLGNLGLTRSGTSKVQQELDAIGVPYSVSIGEQDTHAEAFIKTFGPGDYTAWIGHVRFLNFDSANRLVSDVQLDRFAALSASTTPGLAVTFAAPVPIGAASGWRSMPIATRVLGALSGAGFRHVFSGDAPRAAHREFAGMSLYDLGGGAGAGDTDRVAWVTVTRPWSVLIPCGKPSDCAGGICESGFCRTRCSSDNECADACPADTFEGACACFENRCGVHCLTDQDCPGASPECVEGRCALDPSITVSLRDR